MFGGQVGEQFPLGVARHVHDFGKAVEEVDGVRAANQVFPLLRGCRLLAPVHFARVEPARGGIQPLRCQRQKLS